MVEFPRQLVAGRVGGGEEDRRGLAGHARDAEDGGGEDAGQRVGQHVVADRLPLGRAERERAFAETLAARRAAIPRSR